MPEPTDSVVEVTVDGGVVTARITTSSVKDNAPQAILMKTQEAIDEAGGELTDVVLDFGDVEFIDSSGLGKCFELRNDIAGRGARVILYQPTEAVLQLFMVVKMESLFTIVHTADELRSVVASPATEA
ncbi:MAG: STAS domain-containing protein [Planctomycetota bacterium]|jgi:anti-anti-sigma factor